jgi:hypothetical protein
MPKTPVLSPQKVIKILETTGGSSLYEAGAATTSIVTPRRDGA